MAILALLKIKFFSNNGYYVIISASGVSNKILTCNLSYIVHAVMWPIFCNSSISMRAVIIASNWPINNFFEGCSWFKFNNLRLPLVKTKIQKVLGLIPTFVEVAGGKLVGGLFGYHPSWKGLKALSCPSPIEHSINYQGNKLNFIPCRVSLAEPTCNRNAK